MKNQLKNGLLKRFESTNASIKVRKVEDVVSRFRVYLEQESKLIIISNHIDCMNDNGSLVVLIKRNNSRNLSFLVAKNWFKNKESH